MIPIHQHPKFNMSSITHGWTAIEGPDFRGSPQTTDHAQLVNQLSSAVKLQDAAWVTQVHGGDVLQVESGGWAGRADGLWTDKPGLGVIGRSADCPLILISGPKSTGNRDGRTHAWGFAHASWRSTLAGITASLVQSLNKAGVKPTDMQACICPSAGPCCYEVKDDVVQAAGQSHPRLSKTWFSERDGRIFLDLWQANRDIMVQETIPTDQILATKICTICNLGFHSFRRDGDAAGRFAGIIGGI